MPLRQTARPGVAGPAVVGNVRARRWLRQRTTAKEPCHRCVSHRSSLAMTDDMALLKQAMEQLNGEDAAAADGSAWCRRTGSRRKCPGATVAAPTDDGERAVPSLRLTPEQSCDDR